MDDLVKVTPEDRRLFDRLLGPFGASTTRALDAGEHGERGAAGQVGKPLPCGRERPPHRRHHSACAASGTRSPRPPTRVAWLRWTPNGSTPALPMMMNRRPGSTPC